MKNAELTEARSHLAQMEQTLGEKITDGEDAATATRDLQTAALAVTQLTHAVDVARQRVMDAEAKLRRAETDATREALREKLVQLADVGRRGDAQMAAMGQLASAASHLIGEIQKFSLSELKVSLKTAIGWLRIRMLDSCEAMPECLTGEDLYKTRLPWSSHLPEPSESDRLIK